MVGTCIIVEHDPWNMQLLRMYVERLGLRLLEAFDGPAAVALVQRSRPDVILVNVELPGTLDSKGVISVLRADPVTRNIPIILTTSLDREAAEASLASATYCLGMPPTYSEFLTAMVEAGIDAPGTPG